jgi:hypothetical protein
MRAKPAFRECRLPKKMTNQFMRIAKLSTFFLLPVLLIASGLGSRCAWADDGPVETVADLFENDVLGDNVFGLLEATKRLPVEARYEILKSHVLPGKLHREFRLFGKLTSTDPSVSAAFEDPADVTATQAGIDRSQRQIHSGGILVSPVFDLIAAAKEAEKLDELRLAVQTAAVTGEVQLRCQLSLLALIAMAMGDEEAAGNAADRLFDRLLTGAFPGLADRMPETLFVWAAAEQGVLITEAERFLVHIWDHQVQPAKLCGPGEWDRLISSLIGRVRYLKLEDKGRVQHYHQAPELRDWQWVTKKYAWVVGNGIPAGHAHQLDRTVVQLSREDDEYLLFATPLRGNFTVECECSGFGYKDCHPFVAGKWLAPVHTYDTAWIGDITKSLPNIALDPKLSQVDDWIRYRIDMRDGVCSRFINGRLIHEENLGANHDPWVAIRTPSYGEGSVRDVRITGSPVVPEQISLSAQGIESWISWHDDQLHPEKFSWIAELLPQDQIHLVSPKDPTLAGSAAERQLRYHWPLVWDSEVAYDFYFSKDKSLVHPSIGQLAFLLTDRGIKTHRITHGVWESTGSDPLNQHEPAPEWRERPLPLLHNTWNTMKLRAEGQSVTLELNGTIILRHLLDRIDDRTFGLFHYCDQSEARVRNVVLKGAWPQALPPLIQQELRGTQSDELDRQRDELPERYEFDFAESTREEFLPAFLFTNSNTGTESTVEIKDDGLHASAKAPAGTMALAFISPRITIHGDFDITLDYEKLSMEIPDVGGCGIYESLVFQDLGNRTSSVIRNVSVSTPNAQLRHISHVELIDQPWSRSGATYPSAITDESLIRTSKNLSPRQYADVS